MAINKVQYNGKTLIDLTNDTVTDNTLIAGATAHAADGERIVGAFDPTIYLEKTGNASDVTTVFAQATARANIATGETLAISMGKIAKNLADIKGHAFKDTVNNLATTTTGSALDATQGKLLNDAITKNANDIGTINNNLNDIKIVNAYENRCTELAGGYIKNGRGVTISIIAKILIASDNNVIITDLPRPLSDENYPVLINNITQMTNSRGWVNAYGSLCIATSNVNDWLLISGSYISR